MTEGYIDLFANDRVEGNKPHFRGFIKINGERLEFACWPARSGKPGVFSGKVKPEQKREQQQSYGGYSDGSDAPF